MADNKDLDKLIPGAKYNVKIVPKNLSDVDAHEVSSFNYQFVVPNDWPVGSGSPIPSNQTGKNTYTGPGGTYSSSNMFINKDGIFAYKSGSAILDVNRTVWIDANTGNAYFSGSIVATSGSIGGFTIVSDNLYGYINGKYSGIRPSSFPFYSGANNTFGDGAKFSVDTYGNLYAQSASFAGTLTAPTIITGSITANAASFGFSSNSQLVGGAIYVPNTSSPKFTVDSAGNLVAQSASITGQIVAQSGTIGGYTIRATDLYGGTGTSFVGLSASGTYSIFSGATNSTGSGAKFSVTPAGDLYAQSASIIGGITANSGYIGGTGGWKISTGYITSGAGSGSITLDGANNKIYIGSGSYNNPNTSFYVDGAGQFSLGNKLTFDTSGNLSISGSITASSGTIAGWSVSGQEISKNSTNGTHIALNSGPINPKIYIGQGNHASQDTGFYVDSTGRFSLSNQLYFIPDNGTAQSSSTVASTNINSYQITTTIDNSSGSVLYKGILAMGTDLDVDTYAASVTNTNPAIVVLNKYPLNTNVSSSITFKADNFSQLTVTGKIKGAVESVTPIQSPKLFSTITSASVGADGSVVIFNTTGHSFISGEHLILQGLSASGNLSNLNYSASSGNSYSIISASNSSSFSISIPTSASLIAGNYTPISGSVSIQELTMGLHPSEGYVGTPPTYVDRESWYHDAGIGVRLDKYNWWFTNNQFRVGTDETSFKWDGSKFKVKGGGLYTLEMSVGSSDTNNYFAIYNSNITTLGYGDTYSDTYYDKTNLPFFNNIDTPFYVDATGKFSLGNQLTWNPSTSTLAVKGTINGQFVGFGGPNSGSTNVALGGDSPLFNNNGGIYNIAIGSSALYSNIRGMHNIALGYQSLFSNTNNNGEYNTAIGYQSLFNNTNGQYNTAIGFWSLLNNISGTYNVALGAQTLQYNTTGNANVAIGEQSLFNNTTGYGNIGLGVGTLRDSASGDSSIAIGNNAIGKNLISRYNIAIGQESQFYTQGDYNISIGYQSLYSASTIIVGSAVYINNTGSSNIAIGYQTLHNNVTGNFNTSMGSSALYSNIDGAYNTALGYQAMRDNTSGPYNIALGYQAMLHNTIGDSNIAIGYQALTSNATGVANIAFGQGALLYSNGDYNIGIGDNTLSSSSGTHNVAMGSFALYSSSVGINNVAIGNSAMQYSQNNENVAIGYQALNTNVTGYQNVAIGTRSMIGIYSSSGAGCTFVGWESGLNITNGYYNVGIGLQAFKNLTTGADNTAIGCFTGQYQQGGSFNTYVGFDAGAASSTPNISQAVALGQSAVCQGTLSTAIGATAVASANYEFVLGVAANNVRIPGTLTTYGTVTLPDVYARTVATPHTVYINSAGLLAGGISSSRKYKNNIQIKDYSIDTLKNIEIVSFNYKEDNSPDVGVIAEQINENVPELKDFVLKNKDGEIESFAYDRMVMPLVVFAQKQQKQIELLQEKIDKLEKLISGSTVV